MTDNPVCDVILGRVPGSSFECTETVAAVQTRAQRAKEQRPFRPLLTTKALQLDVNSEQVGKLQREDASLESMFKKRESVEAVEDDNSVTSFVVQEGLLYNRVRSKLTDMATKQLVVPYQLRPSFLIAAHGGLFGGHMGAGSTFKRISSFFFWQMYRNNNNKKTFL